MRCLQKIRGWGTSTCSIRSPGLRELFSLGLYVPRYARVNYSGRSAVGRFSSHAFDPNRWKPNYPNAAFESRLPGDEYWGAKKVLAFTDEEIRAMVKTASIPIRNRPRRSRRC